MSLTCASGIPPRHNTSVTEVIHLHVDDDLSVLRSHLRRAQHGRVVLSLPWDAHLLSRPLDCELLLREAERLGLEVAVVSPDPERRGLARRMDLATFSTVDRARVASSWRHPERERIEPPRKHWWQEEIPLWPPPTWTIIPRWVRRVWQGARLTVFLVTLIVLVSSAIIVVPRATITLIPEGETVTTIVAVTAIFDSEMEEEVDIARGLIPARRVGDYFEGYMEVETSGTAAFLSGRALGTVLFTNVLAQDMVVPAGTVVRTSAGSFPIRFATIQEVIVPALGQAPAPIEALEEGPAGNVGVNQINRIEGIAGLAIRVTNPEPTAGGSTQAVRAVSQADMDRARELLTARLLDEAHEELQATYLEPTEFMPRPSLEIQGTELSYNRFLAERADTLGLHMRLLVTGLVVDQGNAGAVAYTALAQSLPAGYELVGAGFEIGEMAEEPVGSGDLTLFVTATGYAAARLDPEEILQAALGQPLERAVGSLETDFPLAESPQVTVWPDWFPRMPLLPLRIAVYIIPLG